MTLFKNLEDLEDDLMLADNLLQKARRRVSRLKEKNKPLD